MTRTTKLRLRAAVILAGALTASGAITADPTPAVRAVAGPWRLSEVGGKLGCTLNLTDISAPGGLAVKVPPACRRAFPPIIDLAAWSVDDKGSLVRFSDSARRPIIQFQPRTDGGWEGQGPDGAAWRLERAAPARTEPMATPPGGPAR